MALPLTIALTVYQACDADLVSRVVRVQDNSGLPANRLMLGVPVDAVRMPEAVDNLGVLAEMGVRTALGDFALGPEDLAAAQDFGVHTVRVATRWVDLRTRTGAGYASAVIPVLHDTGILVLVDGVMTQGQATWWRDAGADLATGPYFGPDQPAADFHQHVRVTR